eukprot:9232911-Alexandrium_andersonii.AAC.1
MSASLVGSEMCIRDSNQSVDPSISQSREQVSKQASKRASKAKQHTRTPVSYTHLTLPTICSV